MVAIAEREIRSERQPNAASRPPSSSRRRPLSRVHSLLRRRSGYGGPVHGRCGYGGLETRGPAIFRVLVGHRFYQPEAGRWVSRDPLGEMGADNLFRFVANNPLLLIDAHGLLDKCLASQKGECRAEFYSSEKDDEEGVIVYRHWKYINITIKEGQIDKLLNKLSNLSTASDIGSIISDLAVPPKLVYDLIAATGSSLSFYQIKQLVTKLRETEYVTVDLQYRCETCKCKKLLFWEYYRWVPDDEIRTYRCNKPGRGLTDIYSFKELDGDGLAACFKDFHVLKTTNLKQLCPDYKGGK